jgi:acetyl/propionyl-CoA carboxylase alpha subunit
VYSDFDRYSLYTKLADEAYHIGESPAAQSYLLADKIIDVAKKSGAEAIHPGYGFLSERAVFARACASANIKFIGPPHTAIDDLGSKTKAKQLAIKNNIPVVAGTNSAVQDIEEAKSIAQKIGFPVMIKASAGGGGKGMRVVRAEEELEASIRMAQNEARSSFGDESVFIEKYVDSPKHIEFQVLVDEHGNAVHLGERECSMQRRHQKIIEETPCSIMDDDLRYRMGECAKKIVLAAGYTNAGTVEFMVDKDKNFYFLEVNTRLQVEHPITEMRTGIDLVEQQLKIASGEKLSFSQKDVKLQGAAIECRICAEDPDNNFMPSIGKLKYISRNLGNGMREDTGIEQGNEISIYYDSMITKLISYGPDRKSAIDKMERALRNYTIVGVKTNISFLLNLLKCPEYFDGNYNTQFVERIFLPRLSETKEVINVDLEKALAVASVLFKEKNENAVKVKTGKNGNSKNSWLRRKELH